MTTDDRGCYGLLGREGGGEGAAVLSADGQDCYKCFIKPYFETSTMDSKNITFVLKVVT